MSNISLMCRKIIFFTAFCAYLSLICVYAENNPKIPKRFIPEDEINRLNSAQQRGLDFDAVVKKINIKPGMTILDIGAGTGVFTLRFAKALNNTGKVYATELDSEKTEYIRKEGLKSGYTNIIPVVVDKNGVDQFYKQHVFDIVFMCETVDHNFSAYFDQIRPCINKEKGHLYIVDYDSDLMLQSFGEEDIDDFKSFVKNIISWKDSPLYPRLSAKSRDFIDHWDNSSEIPSEAREVIRKDINLIFSDRFFLADMYDHLSRNCNDQSSCLSPLLGILDISELELIRWIYSELDADLIYDSDNVKLTPSQKKDLNTVNYILLSRLLKPNSQSNPSIEESYSPFFITRKKSIISKLEAIGFKFVEEYELPKRYFLKFKREI